MILKYLILIFLIIVLFLILFKKKYEYFDKLNNGLLCGTENNICTENEFGKNSCCKGYNCIRPNGNYLNKYCKKKSDNNIFDGVLYIDGLNNNKYNDLNINGSNSVNSIGKGISQTFNDSISDIDGAFSKLGSGLGSFFSGMKIDLGNVCK